MSPLFLSNSFFLSLVFLSFLLLIYQLTVLGQPHNMHALLSEKFMVHFCLLFSRFYMLNRYGSWGVCYTYGTWFGIKGLVAAGKSYENSASIRKACNFLLSKQLPSGGWGESYLSCQNKVDLVVNVNVFLSN